MAETSDIGRCPECGCEAYLPEHVPACREVLAHTTPREEWNKGGGDRDQPYRFGNPQLTDWQRAKLLLLRGGIRDGKFDGDIHPDEGKGEN